MAAKVPRVKTFYLAAAGAVVFIPGFEGVLTSILYTKNDPAQDEGVSIAVGVSPTLDVLPAGQVLSGGQPVLSYVIAFTLKANGASTLQKENIGLKIVKETVLTVGSGAGELLMFFTLDS